MKKIINKAFTLVELIVVITILAILGTIAFINLQGYSVSARDSKRLSDITNILKKISVEETKGLSVIGMIDNQTTATGIINNQAVNLIKGTPKFIEIKEDGSKFKDPITKLDYILGYSKGGTGTGAYKFLQIATVNEERNEAVVKGNYYMIDIVNDSPSIIKNSSGNFVVDGNINLPYAIQEGVIVSGPIYYTINDCNILGDVLSTNSTYGSCDSTDMIICTGSGTGYIMSSCNIGTNISGTGYLSYGDFFQWGNNFAFSNTGTLALTSSAKVSTAVNNPSNYYNSSTYIKITSPNYDWSSTTNNNLWGGTSGTNIARQGPCVSGYHIPKNIELTALSSSNISGDRISFSNKFKMPLSGYRHLNGGYIPTDYDFVTFVPTGRYWGSDDLGGTFGPYIDILYGGSVGNSGKSFGYNIRCFKN
ncbi:MAG: type II secretion system protein [Candidatus Gracilibacteria bacterium]|nr:type II secretion system protein [Candidatus Gracilibacteria bacterium]